MNKNEYLAFHKACCDKMIDITAAKNADYVGTSNDPFANFRRVETLGITNTSRGFLVRMTDKLSRITSFVQKGILLVKDESVEDTLLDLANYCLLMMGYLTSEKEKQNEVEKLKKAERATVTISREDYEKLLKSQVSALQDTDNIADMQRFLEKEVADSRSQWAKAIPTEKVTRPLNSESLVQPLVTHPQKGF